jgi:hypothetical protein
MRAAIVFLIVLTCVSALVGQADQSTGRTEQPASSSATDYSGMYSFLRQGEFVQITVEEKGKLTGFVSRYGDLDSDRDAFLDHFFKKGSIEGQNLNFTTETVHGVWFEFKGRAQRGDGKTTKDEGYYVLKGTLTEHATDRSGSSSVRSREVVLKSFPEDVSGPAGRSND